MEVQSSETKNASSFWHVGLSDAYTFVSIFYFCVCVSRYIIFSPIYKNVMRTKRQIFRPQHLYHLFIYRQKTKMKEYRQGQIIQSSSISFDQTTI